MMSLDSVKALNLSVHPTLWYMEMDCREILVVGLNPAFQTTLHFKAFSPGKVNRAYRKAHSIGGKGQNVAIACEQYGEADKITLLQFIGGRTGSYVQDYLCEKGIHQVTEAPTRQCTTLLDGRTGEMTELIEPPGRISLQEKELLENISQQLVKSPRLEGIALCGSLPGGVTGSTFSAIIENKTPSTVVFLDACKDLDVLKTGKVDILKVNCEEAVSIANLDCEADLMEVGLEILKSYPIKIVAITNGPNAALLFQKTSAGSPLIEVSEFDIPDILQLIQEESLNIIRDDSSSLSKSLPEAIGSPCYSTSCDTASMVHGGNPKTSRPLLNPLGAGDACSGVFLLEFLDTQDPVTAYRYGLAAASASCVLIDCTSHFSKSTMKTIFDQIRVKTLKFILCARYGELEEMINLICTSCQVSEISEIPFETISSLIKEKNSALQSALHLSAANGHLNVVQFLIKYLHPIDVNVQTVEGSTPLHWAALNGHLAIVEQLIEAGADATLQNASGRSPVTLAEQQSHLEVVQVLLKSYDPEDDEEEEIVDNIDVNCNGIENEN